MRNKILACCVLLTMLCIGAPLRGQTTTYHVDKKNPACADAVGSGSVAKPYCSLRYVSTIAKPGETFIVKSGRYGDGPETFRRSGTATAPITYRADGDVVIGAFDDVRDEDFKPTAVPHVYALGYATLNRLARVHQTHFDPILVDDPNPTIFTMKEEDGPLYLTRTLDPAILAANDGTWLYDDTLKQVQVHPFGNRVPSLTGTDFVISGGGTLLLEAFVEYNVLDGFRITYSSFDVLMVLGKNNTFRNLTFQDTPWQVRGSNNTAENITVTHVIARGPGWLWHTGGDGTAMGVIGAGHRMKNIHLYHNWNSSLSSDGAPGLVIDGLKTHGAPNHCGTVDTNNTIRNAILYNCQDYFYLHQTDNVLIEHVVTPQGVSLQGLSGPVKKVTIRNSIFPGTFGYSSASRPEHCQWEADSVMENNIIWTGATIVHCADRKSYPIADYMSKCASGVLTGCMTIRNNKMVSDWKTVIKDGMWTAAHGDSWDVSLVANSPAIDAGMVTGTTTDITGAPRPLGAAPDAGVYEVARPVDCVVSAWGAWQGAGAWTYANWSQSRGEARARTVTTPASGGGAACPVLSETRTATQACQSITVNTQLAVVCNPQ